MFVSIMLAVLCVLPGMLSGILQMIVLRRPLCKGEGVRTVAAYIALFYGILSAVKTVFDGGRATLAESFGDAVPLTYLHYLIPLILLAVVLPGLDALVFRRTDLTRLLSLFDSFMCLFLLLAGVTVGRIGNALYLAALAVCASAALAVVLFYRGGGISFCTRDEMKDRLRCAAPSVLFYVVTIVLVIPGILFVSNDREIVFVPSSVARTLLIGALVCSLVLLCAGVLFLTQRQFELFYTLLFALTLAGYIQNLALNRNMLVMDGSRQTWSAMQCLLNLIVWIALLALCLALRRLTRVDIARVYRGICVYLCLVQLVSLGYMILVPPQEQRDEEEDDDDDSPPDGGYILTTEGSLDLHPTDNVLVFVLDWYDEQILEKVLAADPDFLEPLDGFTRYANATSRYAFTQLSLPYMLTGVEKPNGMAAEEYQKYAFENGHVLDDIAAAGYDIKVYTDMENLPASTAAEFDNYQSYQCYCKIWPTMTLMLRCARYQTAPFLFKPLFWYTSDAFDALAYDSGSAKWSAYDDLLLNDALYRTGLNIERTSDDAGCFKFYHLYGVHPPYFLSEHLQHVDWTSDYDSMISAARGSMMIVYHYLDLMKQEGLYDNATIIITADHGENYLYDEDYTESLQSLKLQYTSGPILLIKNPGEKGEVRTSMAPVSHAEVIASIVKAINPQAAAAYGRTVEEVGETEEGVRVLSFGRDRYCYDIEITGDAMDPDNWRIVE